MRFHHHSCSVMILAATAAFACAAGASAQSTSSATQPASQPLRQATSAPAGLSGPQRIAWSSLDAKQQEQLQQLLADADWPIRVFALLRLERFSGDEPAKFIRNAVTDQAWQARCFALRAMARLNLEIDPVALEKEMDPHVLRAALRAGAALPAAQIKPHAQRLLKTRGIEELMLGLEIAASCDIAEIRSDAEKRIVTLARNMDDAVALLISRRLALILGLQNPPENARAWRAWLASKGDKIALASPEAIRRASGRAATPLLDDMDDDTFTRLLDYLSALRQRDLDLVIVMDATASMVPMVNQARAGIDSLILFMDDISRKMRLAFVAYRDHDNAPVWDGHPFTTDITSIRKYLFDLRITGGADYPEAVLEGLGACEKLEWDKKATREIVLVGDAPPHDEDVYQVHALMTAYRDAGITVHAVHVPMAYPPGHYGRLTPEQAEEARTWLENYNNTTGKMFADIADAGGGKKTELKAADQLVPSIMHFTIEEAWWPVFDEFYAVYLEVCR